MLDVIGSYKRAQKVYQWYIESAFPLRDSILNRERARCLAKEGVLSQPPLLETVPIYEDSGLTLADASKLLPPEYADLAHLAAPLMGDRTLYAHQWDALQAVIEERQDIVVTTGTGSGKTECFLLPLLAMLAKDSRSWVPCPPATDDHEWWKSKESERVAQWAHSGRNFAGQHAVRGMILYPLNALVEDQLRRLRRTLDSDEAHAWMDEARRGNRILFGRYTGETPVAGRPTNTNAMQRLRRRLGDIASESAMVKNPNGLDPEIRYHFPNIHGGEMWSRWDMQETPPDIMITNYSMLNIMLMRSVEEPIFEQTKAWLKQSKENRFSLIIDELHSYRGTPGTEVAYILRLLLDRLEVPDDQLTIMATSASVSVQTGMEKDCLLELSMRNTVFHAAVAIPACST